MQNNNIEILAPAGTFEALKAAVYAGADSVYFGAKTLNARRNAENFTDREIRQAVDFCRLYNVKTYLTLNTVMFDTEIESVCNEIKFACETGFDAIIVQDIGVLSLINKICPDIAVHASTQMSVHNLADANYLYEMGISRVVLAREMSKNEIGNIAQNSKIEIEVFVHGALCFCVSGQCYFSAFLGHRSGNRGLCAQVCRLPFGVYDSGRHNLSLKDLTLIDYVDELKRLGVTALKIEGRMKGPGYVKTAVEQFKNAVEHRKYDKDVLEKSFSRSGFTQAYYLSSINKNMFGTRKDADILKSKEIVYTENSTENKIPIDMTYDFSKEKVELTASDDLGNMTKIMRVGAQTSVNKPLTHADAAKSLSKLNDTPFCINNISGRISDGIYLSVADINELRRNAVADLIKKRQQRKPYRINDAKLKLISRPKKDTCSPARFTASFFDPGQIGERVLNALDYAGVDIFKFNEIDKNIVNNYKDKLVAEIPRVYFEDEKTIVNVLTKLKQAGITKAKCHSLGRLKMAKDLGFDVIAGFGLNITNSISAEFFSRFKPLYITLSPELSVNGINDLNTANKTCIVSYGHFPLMISRVCPAKYETGCQACKKSGHMFLTDRKGKRFAVLCTSGTSQIFNSVPLYIADKLNSFKSVDYFELLFTTEKENDIYNTIMRYVNRSAPDDDFTRGIYFRKLQ